jgi:type IV pilus assembly protein PilY1
MTRTTLSQAFSKIGNSVRIAWQNMANTGGVAVRFGATAVLKDIGDFQSTVRKDFYDWIFQVVGGNTTPARAATIRASNVFRAPLSKDENDPYWNGGKGNDSADLVCRRNFHMLVTDGYWNEDNPSLPGTADNGAPAMDSSNTSEVAQTLPDQTKYSPTDPVSQIYGNVTGDVLTSSMANISWYYWATDLQPNLTNGVKRYFPDMTSVIDPKKPEATPAVYWNPANDPATWQHVAQFFVTLGVAGTLNFPGDLPNLKDGTKAWPQPKNNAPEGVDDTWHGAINSRGGFFSASDPATLVNGLVNIINSVLATTSSAVAAPLNSGVITTGTVTYEPKFSSTDWSGTLEAFAVNSTGGHGTVHLWEANEVLMGRQDARIIVTSAGPGEGKGVDYQFANMTTAQKNIMKMAVPDELTPANTTFDTNGTKRVNWVRGDRTDEGTLLRTRASLLGSIVNAQPVYVSFPASGYRDFFPPNGTTIAPETAAYTADPKKSYSQYVADNATRQPVLYTAANDGMLHAFDARLAGTAGATPGKELWAYVPSASYQKLWYFSRRDNFAYKPTVDATPVFRDVYFSQTRTNSSPGWHTILVGGLRYGGRGIYALDITDPSGGNAATVAKKVLWEFNSDSVGGANLGYTFGQPNVGRLANGKWVVLVPGGYFPSDNLDPAYNAAAATSKFSSLFVLDAQTGVVLKEFQTPVGAGFVPSFGLGPPVLGDYDNDQIDDVAFAGDLAGNLWRFDLRDITKGTVDLIYTPTADLPTKGMVAGDQPITSMPRLFPDPTSQYFIVVFGTGKFLGDDDRTTTGAKIQTVFGIRDPGLGNTTGLPWKRANLVAQDLVEDTNSNRGLTSNPVGPNKGGWYFDLDVSVGERVVVTPTALFNTNRVIITTLIPTTPDPCNPGRAGALMVVDATSGSPGAGVQGSGAFGAGYSLAGVRVDNPPATGNLPAATTIGGGTTIIPGVTLKGTTTNYTLGSPIWRRRSWRILNDQ